MTASPETTRRTTRRTRPTEQYPLQRARESERALPQFAPASAMRQSRRNLRRSCQPEQSEGSEPPDSSLALRMTGAARPDFAFATLMSPQYRPRLMRRGPSPIATVASRVVRGGKSYDVRLDTKPE